MYKVSLPYYYYQLIGCYVGFIAVVNTIANLYHGLRQFVVTYMQVRPVSCGYQHTYKTFLLIAECCKDKKEHEESCPSLMVDTVLSDKGTSQKWSVVNYPRAGGGLAEPRLLFGKRLREARNRSCTSQRIISLAQLSRSQHHIIYSLQQAIAPTGDASTSQSDTRRGPTVDIIFPR